jgi:hypothetical protein
MSLPGSDPAWTASPPGLFDIVASYFPEHTDPESPGLKLRPSLVVKVLRGKTSGRLYCNVAYGTKHLKITKREHLDLIVQNSTHIQQIGLARATRFDLDNIAIELPWTPDFFGCWAGHRSPVIGTLTQEYIKVYAYLMMRRGLVPQQQT